MWRRIWRGVIWLVDWLGRVELVRTIMDAAWWAKLIAVVSTGGYLGWLAESVPWVFLLPQGVLLFTSTVWVLDRFGRPSTGRAVSAQEEQGLMFSLIYPEPERDDDWVRQRIVVTNVSSALARSCALVVKRISPPPPGFQPGPLALLGRHQWARDLPPEWPQRFEVSEWVLDEEDLEWRVKVHLWAESPTRVCWLDSRKTYDLELVVTGDDVRPERWTCTVQGSDGVITRLEPSRSPGERSSRRRLGSSSPAPPHDRHF